MKIFASINPRDRSLLVLIFVAIIFFLCYMFVISPNLEKANLLKPNIQAVENELINAENILGGVVELERQEENQRAQMKNKYSVFFFDLKDEDILYKMDSLILEAGLEVQSYLPSPLVISQVVIEEGTYEIQGYPLQEIADQIYPQGVQNLEQGAGSTLAVESPDMIPCRSVSIDFSGATYEKVHAFISSVEQMRKTVLLKSITLSKEEAGVGGQLTLDFYSIPPFDSSQKGSLEFVPVIPKGKVNPFN